MNELEIQGKKYISSKRASELTGYAKDYIGQLARAGKVLGTRVGRAWYVEEEAILTLAGKTALPEAPVASPVALAVKEYTIPSVRSLSITAPSRSFHTWSSVQYLKDPQPLIPSLLPQENKSSEITIKTLATPAVRNTIQASRVTPRTAGSTDGVIKRTRESLRPDPQTFQPQSKGKGYTYGGIIVAMSVAFVLIALGASVDAQWSFAPGPHVAETIGGVDQYNPLGEYFLTLFYQGVDLLRTFILMIWGSLWAFFDVGFQFILVLLHKLG